MRRPARPTRPKRSKRLKEVSKCRFCREKVKEIDYKDIPTIQKLTTAQGKIFSRKRSGNCAKHQRSTAIAIKRARFIGLAPFVG